MVMKQTMSTLGCPEWDLSTMCERASEYGFEAVDLRIIAADQNDLRTEGLVSDLEKTKSVLDNADLPVSGLSSSIRICESDDYEKNLTEAERLIELADELNTDYVRLFGGGNLEEHTRADLVEAAGETMTGLLKLDGARSIRWVVETHDNWTSGSNCHDLLEEIDDPNVGALWDIGHTARVGGETPRETYNILAEDIEYVHVKDAIHNEEHSEAMDDGWRYVVPGTGDLPIAEGLELLAEEGYDGWVMFEHEKRWHPELEDPAEAYPSYVQWVKSVDFV